MLNLKNVKLKFISALDVAYGDEQGRKTGARWMKRMMDHKAARLGWYRKVQNNDNDVAFSNNKVLTKILRGPIAKILWSWEQAKKKKYPW